MIRLKISLADRLFSLLVRARAGWRCERCFTPYPQGMQGLDCSHFHGRAKQSTRRDPDNGAALCRGCHLYMTANPEEHRTFFINRLGQKRFDLLTVRANTPRRGDEMMDRIWLKEELKKRGVFIGRGPALSTFDPIAAGL